MSYCSLGSRGVRRLLSPIKRLPLSALLVPAALLIEGCSLKQSYPDKLTYILAAERTGEAVKSSSDTVLQVHTLRTDAAFEG